jgi:YggT family protein
MVGYILSWVFQVFIWLLFARFIIELVRSANRGWRPSGVMLFILEGIMTVTDVPLKVVRKVIKPVRVGVIQFDLAWTVLLLLLILARNYVQYLPF